VCQELALKIVRDGEGATRVFRVHVRGAAGTTDAESIKHLHPDNPRFQRLTVDDRLIVSEPFADLPGVWQEIPPSTAVTVRRGGVLEERPFRPTYVPASPA
jgi:glutamine amidotransferase